MPIDIERVRERARESVEIPRAGKRSVGLLQRRMHAMKTAGELAACRRAVERLQCKLERWTFTNTRALTEHDQHNDGKVLGILLAAVKRAEKLGPDTVIGEDFWKTTVEECERTS